MNKKPEILVLVGIPNSGKTTFRYTKEEEGYWSICRDDIRELYWGKKYIYSKANEDEVTRISNKSFEIAIKNNLDVIIDNTHCKENYIQEWIKKKPANYNLKIVLFEISLFKVHIRNIIRWLKNGKWIPIKVINQMKKNFDKLDKSKYEKYNLQS